MAVSNVELRVDARQAVNALQQVNSVSKQTSASTQQLQNAIARSGNAMDGMGRQARNASSSISGLGSAITKLAAAAAIIQSVRFVFAQTAEIETQTRSIQVLTGSVEKSKQIISELQAIGAVTPFTSTELIDAAKRLSAFGVSADQVVETTRRLGDVAGATGANLGELTLAYGQVIAKGRLQGEELLQFQERGIALQDELRKMYGLSGEEFQKALSKGQISAEAVEVAIKRLTEAGGKYANGAIAQSDTLNGKLSTLQDSFQRLAQNIGKFFEPVFKFLIDGINAFLERVNSASRLQAEVRANEAASLAARQKFGLRSVNPFDQEVAAFKDQVRRSAMANFQRAPARTQITTPRTPPLAAPSTPAGGGGKSGRSAADKAARDAERAAEAIRDQLKTSDDLNFSLKNQLAIIQETDAGRRIAVEYESKLLEIGKKYTEQRQASKSVDNTILIGINEEIERKIVQIEYEREINRLMEERAQLVIDITRAASMPTVFNELEQQKAALEAILEKYPAIGTAADAAANLATSGIADIVSGAKSAEQVFIQFLNSIANALIDTAKQMITQYISIGIARMFAGLGGGGIGSSFVPVNSLPSITPFNPLATVFGGARANGGSVMAGQGYLVGERGPELFMPGRSGAIAPNGALGGGMSVVVNVDANGTNVQGDQSQGAALGRAIAAAVQAELVKQRRPGGLLTV